MEKKRSQLSSNGIEADASQESNSLDVKENNREGFLFKLRESFFDREFSSVKQFTKKYDHLKNFYVHHFDLLPSYIQEDFQSYLSTLKLNS